MIRQGERIQRLVKHEGLMLKPYKCTAGYLSIGVGRNLITNPLTEVEKKVVGDWSKGISKESAYYLLRSDIARVEKECRQNIPGWNNFDDERQYALFDMCFNMGIKRLLGFKKMLASMAVGDYRGAAKECLNSKYAKDVGKRAERIAKTIETGVFDYDR